MDEPKNNNQYELCPVLRGRVGRGWPPADLSRKRNLKNQSENLVIFLYVVLQAIITLESMGASLFSPIELSGISSSCLFSLDTPS
jgi:hypothetical protein